MGGREAEGWEQVIRAPAFPKNFDYASLKADAAWSHARLEHCSLGCWADIQLRTLLGFYKAWEEMSKQGCPRRSEIVLVSPELPSVQAPSHQTGCNHREMGSSRLKSGVISRHSEDAPY